MKTVFKSSEIAHVWAHQSAPCGKSPGSMSFNGPAFLSYSTEIARHIEHKGRHALPSDVPVFHFGGCGRGIGLSNISGSQLFDYAIEQATKAQQKALRARLHKDWHNGQRVTWLERAKEISEFFGLRRKVDEKAIERLSAAKQRAEKREAKERAARELKARQEQQSAYDAWLRGESDGCFSASSFPIAFRVEGEELVSTLGARVPLDAAKVAFRFALKHKGQTWHRNGETCPVGEYHLDAINEHGIVAGCHRIAWAEVERLSPILSQETTC